MTDTPDPSLYTTGGPVQAEVFVLRLSPAGVPELAGPCGPEPWYMEVGDDEDPVEVVTRLSTNLLGAPLLTHSTSWRRARGSVILSFVVVIRDDQAPEHVGVSIERAALARSGATAAPASIAAVQVIEHGLRHLAWLAKDDPTVQTELSPAWHEALAGYVPEPFQHLG
ncbi:MAG TPA: hypothetical protein VNV65_10540 [Candidatus Solibacter sp.]|jgi:hypothetical protein|nr:hypothetical protein [Candidatus Solibacter sp.]